VDGEKHVKIFRENVAVEAKVFTIGGFSAHADQGDLLEWVGHFVESGPRVFLVHGETSASQALSEKIRGRFGLETHIPVLNERLLLKAREIAVETPGERPEPDLGQAVLNRIIDLEKELDLLRRRVKDKKVEDLDEGLVDALKYIEEELQLLSPA
jgi:metallo-beta-lactamase family protein